MALLFTGSVNAAIIDFEGMSGVVTNQYQSLGVNFTQTGSANVSNGAGWGIVGTNGQNFYGIQANATITLWFNSILSEFFLDTSRSAGSQNTNTFTLTALLNSSVVNSQTILQGAIGDWTTVGFSGFDYDQVVLTSGQGSRPVYGVDNISFSVNAVPEPSMLALVALGIVGIGFASFRRKA